MMRGIRLVSMFAMLVLLLLPGAALAGANGVQALDEAWQKAVLAGDMDGLVACYAEDAVMWAPDSPAARGHDAIRAAYVQFLGGVKVTSAVLSDTQYETSGNLSVGWGTVALTMVSNEGGDPVTMNARFTSVAKKQGGKWVYVVDHVSVPEAAPGE